ncbi:helix-turn-helix transcriptional regulator [Corynebacterium sp. HMSC04H06]|uniref:ArsR/SmtB family transcription factor n=1 Tax=Corynebacterium sp. HMSC04H06 TaxID=1581050 RepID=UPI0008A62798|nr:metalloregulator ArsR/SmtB family transcription factor [Corynebacterium sp. HMSC04H06]OFS21504.1 transcriptional regulator [Corynebacterium sp. HMSC04H06]
MCRKQDAADVEPAVRVLSALDSPLRLHILLLLREREHFVHELVEALDKSQPLISQHLRVLKQAGLVRAERSGREVTYRLAAEEILDIYRQAAALSATLEAEG